MRSRLWNVAVVVLLLSLVLPTANGLAAVGPTSAAARLIARGIVGVPVSAGHYILWLSRDEQSTSLLGYDLEKGSQFVVSEGSADKFGLASDGATVAWIETSATNLQSIRSYDLASGKSKTVRAESTLTEFGGIALDNGVLYYQDGTQNHRGIYALDLASEREKSLTKDGTNPKANNGIVLWAEEKTNGPVGPSQWSLHALDTGKGAKKIELTSDIGPLSGYNVSGPNVVWSFSSPAQDRKAYLYNIDSGEKQALSADSASNPLINGDNVVWTDEKQDQLGGSTKWAVQARKVQGAGKKSVVADSTVAVVAYGVLGDGAVVYTVSRDTSFEGNELYVAGDGLSGMQYSAASVTALAADNTCANTNPVACGQVSVENGWTGKYLVDNGGLWAAKGVSFFLPQYGINNQTFYDGNFNGTSVDQSYWLDLNRNYLLGNVVRIFVQLPDNTNPSTWPTSYRTIYTFLRRASARFQRVGIVFHNNNDWTMSAARRQYLEGLVPYLLTSDGNGNWLPVLAYVSAENEINIQCGSVAGGDCYDYNYSYINGPNAWTKAFADIFKRPGLPRVATTVGIATDMGNGADGLPSTNDFFRQGTDPNVQPLYKSVDFLSPHNYGGNGYGIHYDIRAGRGYQGPIVLEEYGYPTDPYLPNDPAPLNWQKEGCFDPGNPPNSNPACPNYQQSTPSASFFVEQNAQAVRNRAYAGSIAFMIADANTKSCTGGSPPDSFTGLFASGGGYNCNPSGTYTTGGGQPKATGFRVRTHHFYYPSPSLNTTP